MIMWRLFLTPVARLNTIIRSDGGLTVRRFTSWYFFGFRVIHLHKHQ